MAVTVDADSLDEFSYLVSELYENYGPDESCSDTDFQSGGFLKQMDYTWVNISNDRKQYLSWSSQKNGKDTFNEFLMEND